MKIVTDYPPNYDKIVAAIPAVAARKTIIFTYGDTVYNPAGNNLPDHLIAHEQVHIDEQRIVGADAWWDRYLTSAEFRLEQELKAYQKQYLVLRLNYSRNQRKDITNKIAKDLSGPMYGKLLDKKQAFNMIKGEGKL